MRMFGWQWDQVWEDKAANFARVRSLLETVKAAPGDLFVLPEMFSTGFSMNTGLTSADGNAGDLAFLSGLARGQRVFVTAGLVRMDERGKVRNEAVVINPDGKEICRCAKLHPFSLAGEDRYHQAGDTVEVWDWNGIQVVPLVCYDLRFPEVFRLAVLRGAELFTVIANWPEKRAAHWRLLLQARAVENLAVVAGVNRTGRDPHGLYAGGSLMVNPMGEILAEAGTRDEVISAEIDIQGLRDWRARFPALRDLRPSFLGKMEKPAPEAD